MSDIIKNNNRLRDFIHERIDVSVSFATAEQDNGFLMILHEIVDNHGYDGMCKYGKR